VRRKSENSEERGVERRIVKVDKLDEICLTIADVFY
jgi:hypothetical protein